jgi:excisionase family DNA binding protein
METLLTPAEAAHRLRVSVSTLYTWAYRRQIPFQKVGGALRFSPQALEQWLAGQASRTSASATAR